MKRKLWIGLAMWLMLALLCFGAAAEEVTDSGECGENASYMLTGDGTLRITGTGMIEEYFFEEREDIIHVIIGEGITGAGADAFCYCANIQDVSFPSTFTVFSSSCFYDCTGLTSVIIPEGTEAIGFKAFGSCTGLERVTLPASLQSIDDEAFDYRCGSLADVYYGGTIAQWGNIEIGDGNNHLMTATIHCQDGDIENSIRMELENGVLTISGSGYMGDIPRILAKFAREVVIGAGVTNGITRETFEDCNKHIASYTVETGNPVYESAGGALFRKDPLTLILYPGDARSSSFTVPDGVEIIGEHVFAGNGYLSSITLPEGLKEIRHAALFRCTALETITIPASVTFIVPSNLERCSSLTRIDVAEGNTEYKSVNGVLFTEDLTCLLRYPGGRTDTAYTVPAGTTRLGEEAFLGDTILTSVTLPEGLEYIDNNAFYECTALTEVSLPASLVQIGDACFDGCPNLRDVYYAGTTEQWSDIVICEDNEGLKACVIHCSDGDVEPEDITGSCGEEDEDSVTYVLTRSGDLTITGSGEIGSYAFKDNSLVIRAFIGSGITKIGGRAFLRCSALKEITLPASLTEFGYYSFHGCDALETVYYEGTIEQWTELADTYLDNDNPLNLLKAVCSDGEYNPAETVTESGECGENAAYTLTADGCMRISGTGPMYDYDWDGGPWADSSKIRSVIIEEGITAIGDLAFYNCDNLTAISMPDSLTRIGDYGVYVCDLKNVTIPKNVEYVGTWAFSANDRLTEIKVAEGNQYFTTYDGALYDKTRTTLLICPAWKQFYTVPEGVTNIDRAFQGCHEMIQVVLPEGLTSIGGYTFSNLSALMNVTIPHSMTNIDSDAFRNCESLIDIDYNGTIAEWGQIIIGEDNEPLFADQCTVHCTDGDTKAEPTNAGTDSECGENATYTLSDDGTLQITGTGMIEESFFESWEDIIHVIIGEGITGAEYRAFGYCENLLDVSFPSTFTVFENSCFYDCTGLTSVIIPEGTETIGYEAFGYCEGLERVTLPASLQSIDDEAFDYGCRSLTDVYYGGTRAQWENIEIGDGNNHLMTATIHCQDGDIENSVRMEVKNGVLTISGSGYMGDIPDNLARLAREVVIGAGVTNGITRDSFENCNEHIASYTVEAGNPVYESAGGALFRKNPSTLILYPGDARNSSFTVPDGVKIIGEYAFQGNEYLSSITLPEGLEKIGNAALFNCTALESIAIPASVIFIDTLSNLERCSSLTRIDVAEGNTQYKAVNGVLFTEDLTCLLRYPGGCTDTAYTVPAGTTRLGEHAFLGNTILTSVTLPEGVEYMENLAFYECIALTEVTLPVSLTEIEDRCFNGCPNLRDVYYAGTTEQWSDIQIGSDNQDLRACVIHCSDDNVAPEDITGSCGEEDEDSVTYVLTPSGDLTITGNGGIGYGAFARNSRVIRVFIGSGITRIGDYAFDGCSGLKEITLPASLTEFGYRSFHGCDALETIHYGGTIEQWIELVDSYPEDDNPLILLKAVCADGEYDPAETVTESGECGENAAYTLTADGCMRISGTGPMYNYDWNGGQWADESKIKSVIIEEGITAIGDLAFYNCDNLTAISMPDSLTRIGDYGLYICDLESVTIPKNVVYVGIWAFSANFRLTEIKVAEGNQYFTTYDGALYNKDRTTLLICPAGKQSYTVPEGVTNIDQAFQACHNMIQVVLPESLTRIGGFTFSNLSELTSVTIPGSMRSIEPNAFRNCESLTDIYYNGTIAEWRRVGIGEDNGPLFADQCTIHCTDGDTKAEPRPAGMELSVINLYEATGFYFAPGLSLTSGRLYSNDMIFIVTADNGNTGRPAGKPVWTLVQTAGTVSAEMIDGWDINNKYIRLKTMPTQEETAVWHVTCKWGGQTLETDMVLTIREAPSLPTGIEYTGEGPWKVAKGERLEIDGQFRFSDGWSLPGSPVRTYLTTVSPEFNAACLHNYTEDYLIANVPGAYNIGILVQCANINLIGDTTVYFTDTDGVIPWGNYVSPAKRILELPDNVTDIPAETFQGTAAQAVILPENCVSIGEYAFADSPELTEVRLPETLPVSGIDEHAFDGCTGLTVIVARTAEQITWAKENGYIPVDTAE